MICCISFLFLNKESTRFNFNGVLAGQNILNSDWAFCKPFMF